jgi:hypothetical protein
MSNRFLLAIFIAVALLLMSSMKTSVYAAWSNNPADNTPVSAATGNQEDQRITRDESGGAIIVWTDYRGGDPTYGDIYVQKVDADGNMLWNVNGIALTSAKKALNPRLNRDGSGGAFITWEQYNGSNFDIYAQKVDSSGTIKWTSGGVVVCNATYTQRYPLIRTDNNGGAFVVWQDNRNRVDATTTNYDIFIQRIDSTGSRACALNGVSVCSETGKHDQTNPRIVDNSDGTVIVVWQDYRSGTDWDIYAQKIDLSCNMKWVTNGVAVVATSGDQYWQRPAADGSGGAIISWEDYRSGTGVQVYAQRLDSTDGHKLWTLNGVPVCSSACANTGSSTRAYPLLSEYGDGAVVAWQDYRLGTYTHIYAQRLDASGNALWATDGIPVSSIEQTHSQWYPEIATYTNGRSTITWFDNSGLYAQRVDSSGTILWTDGGVVVSSRPTSTNISNFYPAIALDIMGYGAIFAWTDYRNGSSNEDIYAQKVQSNGTLPCADYPVRNGTTMVHYPTIQAAYNAANGQTVQMESIEFTEDLTLNNVNSVNIQGGYNGCAFSSPTEFSTVHGTVTLSGGAVTIASLIIQ